MKKGITVLAVCCFVVAAVFVSGCKLFGGSASDITLEATMPQDLSYAVVFDHSDLGQIKLLGEIVDRVPSMGFFEDLLAEYDSSALSPFKYSENKKLIKGRWKIAIAAKYDGDLAELKKFAEDPNFNFDFDKIGLELYSAGKFEEADRIEELLDVGVEKLDGRMEFLEDEKNPTWRVKNPNEEGTGDDGGRKSGMEFTITRVGDIYFTAWSAAQRDAILKRIEEGAGGFDKNPEYLASMKQLGEKNLGYLYVDGELLGNLLGFIYDIEGLSAQMTAFQKELFDAAIGEALYFVARVDENGVKLVVKNYASSDKAAWRKYYPKYELSLIKRVPADGVIAYSEMPSFRLQMEAFLTGFASQLQLEFSDEELKNIFGKDAFVKADDVAGGVSRTAPRMGLDLNKVVFGHMSSISGLARSDVEKIFDGALAFAVGDSGSYLPNFSIYLQVDEASRENAKKLVAAQSTYIDEVLAYLDEMLEKSNLAGLLKKEIVTVDGAAIQKIYVDWAAVPQEELLKMSMQSGIDLSKIKAELYYGLMSDGVFIVAFHPEFPDVYGKNVIADSAYFKEMRSDAGEFYGYTFGLLRVDPLLDFVDRYFVFVKMGARITGDDGDIETGYEKFKGIASAFRYMYMSSSISDDGMMQITSVKVEKSEFSPELEEEIEADRAARKNAREALKKVREGEGDDVTSMGTETEAGAETRGDADLVPPVAEVFSNL